MAAGEPSDQECPVCHDDYTQPKILRCTHIVCRKCVISWLNKEGNQAGCPLCRAPILPASSTGQTQSDLGSAVDALPTDLMAAAAVESRRILNSPNRCVCDDSTEAKFLCLQCRIKLCNICVKSHKKIPSTQHHFVEDLSNISAEKLGEFQRSSCSHHDDETVKLFCRSHGELICVLCASSNHRQCVDVGGIKEEAKVQREELKKQLERFMEKGKTVAEKIKELDRQIADDKAKFQKIRAEIKATFDDLHKRLDAQYEKLTKDLDEKEEAYLAEKNTPRADLALHQSGLGAHSHIIEKVASASDDFLLDIQSKMKSHLHDLESQDLKYKVTEVKSITLDMKLVTDLKSLICKLGEDGLQTAVSGQSGLGGQDYAKIMKVGDRVRRGRDWDQAKYCNEDGNPPGPGTIIVLNAGKLLSAWAVKVKWDNGCTKNYHMGYDNKYDLQLA